MLTFCLRFIPWTLSWEYAPEGAMLFFSILKYFFFSASVLVSLCNFLDRMKRERIKMRLTIVVPRDFHVYGCEVWRATMRLN